MQEKEIRSCPICRKEVDWSENKYRPFCSDRCKMLDLGNWASDAYRVPGEKVEIESAEIGDEALIN